MNTHHFLANRFLAVASIGLVTAFANTAAAADPHHDVLTHWVGRWIGGVAGGANAADIIVGQPDRAEARWTLDDRYVQGTNSDANGKPIAIWMLGYDDKVGKYHVWYFTSDGIRQWYGVWSDADKTMTWTGDDSRAGTKLAGYTRFKGDEQSWKLTFDDDGKITTDAGCLHKK